MIDQLLKIIQENSQEAIVKNKNIPDNLNQGVQMELMNSIESSLSSALTSGKTNEVMELFGKSAKNQNISGNPLIKMITQNAVENLSKKFNLPPAMVSTLANNLIPQVLGKFAKQTADPKNPSIDMNQVIGALLGKKQPQGVDFNELLEKFAGSKSGTTRQQKTTGQATSKSAPKQQDQFGDILGTLGKLLKR
jgi:uncharacterized protein YidB (DUF937 family)